MAKKKWKKKIGKALTAAATAYVASKMMKGKPTDYEWDASQIKKKVPFVEDIPSDYKHKHLPPMKGHPGGWNWESKTFSTPKGGSVPKTWKDWIPWLKKHGGSITNARLGKMIKAAQGTYAREDESLGMRLGKGKGTAKERDMSYGKWGNRGKDWAKSGKMIKAAHGTEVRTMGSNPFTPKGSVVGVKTKLNGTVKTRVY